MANFYISDLHIGHANIIRFDDRPFYALSDMHETIMNNWNAAVRGDDTVYILGDFCWGNEDLWLQSIGAFAGKKVLIRGNHDPKQFSPLLRKQFRDVQDYMELTDGGRHVILSHYAMPLYKGDFNPDCYMLYGHVHRTHEYDILCSLRKSIRASCVGPDYPVGNFINVGCMLPWMNYTPRTLDEIIAGCGIADEPLPYQPQKSGE